MKRGDNVIIKDNAIEERLKIGKVGYTDLILKYIGEEFFVHDITAGLVAIYIEGIYIGIPMTALTTKIEIRASKIRNLDIL